MERRLSVLCVSTLPRANGGGQKALSGPRLFKVVVLDESYAIFPLTTTHMNGSSRRLPELLKEDRGKESLLEVAGFTAALQLVQVITYLFLEKWKRSWLKCIDTVDESILVQVCKILVSKETYALFGAEEYLPG